MTEIILHCEKILEELDFEFPNQKYYTGIIKDLYRLFEEVKKCAQNGEVYTKKIEWDSLVRQFVDETTRYDSVIIKEMGILEKLVN